MSKDTISRQAAIDAILHNQEVYSNNFGNDPIDKYTIAIIDNDAQTIAQLPSAQQWIPCSERLPDYGVSVLTWDGYCYCVEKRIPYIRDEDGEPITSDWWVSDDYDESNSEYYPNLRDGACIAWMPLPEPWKGEVDGQR